MKTDTWKRSGRKAATPKKTFRKDMWKFVDATTDEPQRAKVIYAKAFPDSTFRAIYCSHLVRAAMNAGLLNRVIMREATHDTPFFTRGSVNPNREEEK